MIFLRNKGASTSPVSFTAGTTVVPFDTLVCNTNDSMSWKNSNNSIVMLEKGRYNTKCTIVFTAASASNVLLELMANGVVIQGDYVEANVSASGEGTLVLNVPIQVTASNGDDSYLQWAVTVTDTVALVNAFADIQGIR